MPPHTASATRKIGTSASGIAPDSNVRGGGGRVVVHTGPMTEHSDPSEDQSPTRRRRPVEEAAEGVDQAALDAYDLDGDGRISLTENVRGELGMLDAAPRAGRGARTEGKVARATHRLLDKLDND